MKTINEILDHYGIPYYPAGSHHHVTAGWIGFDCPFCSPNSNRIRMGFNLSSHYLTCWVCGYHSLFSTLQEITHDSWSNIKLLIESLESQLPAKQELVRSGKLILPSGLESLTKAHKDYLRARGFNPNRIEKLWGIQGIGIHPKYPWRIWIPVHRHGQIVSWTTRSISDAVKSRYRNAPKDHEKIPIKKLLYGSDYCRNTMIICEGPIDVWSIGPGAVATFGISFTRFQLRLLIGTPNRIICFDRDAQRKARELGNLLAPFPGQTSNVILDSKDPGAANKRELKLLRRLL